jgi:acyl-CoA synthetase (NDP forming)
VNRPVYRHAELRPTLHPRSIAVVGVSQNPNGFGAATVERLSAFTGQLYRVNPRYAIIGEHRCYPSVSALPEVPDCVVIATARDMVESIARECAEAGVGGVIIYASGYAETGSADGAALQERLAALSQDSGMRIIGPNCIGLANFTLGANITFHSRTMLADPAPHSIGLVSQSGALGNALTQAIERGVQISHALASGNSCDVDVADLVAYLADDKGCRSIACLFEGMSDPGRMIEAARIAWEADKPLVIYKIAESEQGAAAAMSHTGSLAGSHAAYHAALHRYGAIMVDDLEALLETAAFFAKVPAPVTTGTAVIATSGGATVIAADKAARHGVPLPQPGERVQAILAANIPDFGSARNPCDVTAQVINDPASLVACLEGLFSDPAYGAVILANPYASAATLPRIDLLGRTAAAAGKAGCWISFSDWLEGPGLIEAERNPHVTLFRSFDRCLRTLADWHWRAEKRRTPAGELPPETDPAIREQAARLIDAAGAATLTEREAKVVLSLYGIPVVQEQLVTSADAAVQAAARSGYPVVMKVESPDIPHKTEAGVIRLGVKDEDALRTAFAEIMANARKIAAPDRINGVLVQPMIPAGIEMMAGVRVDPLFGPLLVTGFGGIMVELLRDTALLPAPVSNIEARSMLESLSSRQLLHGFRNSPPVDIDQLVNVICALGRFAADHADRIAEIDINPIICSGDRLIAVDALIIRKEELQ